MAAPKTVSMFSRKLFRLSFVICLMVGVTTVYVTLFQHPPPDKLLEMNKKGVKDFDLSMFVDDGVDGRQKRANDKGIHYDGEDDEADVTVEGKGARGKGGMEEKGIRTKLKGKAEWDKFILDNGFTTIGIVYDRCDNPTEQLGTVVMLPDPDLGGVKSRTFYNFTLDRDLEEGTFSMDVRYNGQELYDNWWEICEMEEDLDPQNRTFSCPIRKGRQSLIKDKHIPNYLPKGRYQSKAWVKDEKGQLLVCGFSDFVL